jgi:hypothetical protein
LRLKLWQLHLQVILFWQEGLMEVLEYGAKLGIKQLREIRIRKMQKKS